MHIHTDHQCRTDRPRLELADIFREYGDSLSNLSNQQDRVVKDITECRTSALGGHIQKCDHCGYKVISYNSCRNRHCSKCQRLEQARWVEDQQKLLLPTEYHHVVFTVPDVLHEFFLANPRQAYNLLFASVSETLHNVALRPKNLGARIGFSLVLHTWTQKLLYHPHIHCIVTGGGLHPDGFRWISAKPGFLFPVRILAVVFRATLLKKLEKTIDTCTISICEQEPKEQLRKASRKKWVVYSKPPFAGPEQVLKYLGRYTHQIVISNERLVSMQDGKVTFKWKDRAHGNKIKFEILDAEKFMRRFLLHIVPKGFMRIRHYGLLANVLKHKLIPKCRELLGNKEPNSIDIQNPEKKETWQELLQRLTGKDATLCPRCNIGHLIIIERVAEHRCHLSFEQRARAP